MKPITAIEIDTERNMAMMWDTDGNLIEEPFRPWCVSMFKRNDYQAQPRALYGDNVIKWLHTYPTCSAFQSARSAFPYGKSLIFDDLRTQFLIQHPEYTLFQNMKFDDLKRFAVDIETTGLNPEDSEIILASCTLGEYESERVFCGDEEHIIEELYAHIQEADPDVIEGHNIFGFDIPFLMRRAEILGLTLDWGRYGEPVEMGRKINYRVGSFERSVQTYKCYGRHIVDSMLVAMRYDSNTGGKFENFGLKYLAQEFGVSCDERIILDRSKMAEEWEKRPEIVKEYAMQDVQETLAITELMVQPEFYLTSLLPDTFQNVLLSGGATKVNMLLVADYIREGYSLPVPPGERTDYEGGFVDCRDYGVFYDVAKVDVSSLYPSIMLNAQGCYPSCDELDSFRRILRSLTERRLQVKAEAKNATGSEKMYLNGMDKAYKVIINGAYGYLATGLHFSDYDAAAKITRVGREIVGNMADQLEALGQYIIEVDTDGVYFKYTDEDLVPIIPSLLSLPDFVNVDMEDTFTAMLSVKAKNYVLMGQDGKLQYHGNSLRSRRDEKFGRQFISDVIDRLLKNKPEWVIDVYNDCVDRIINRKLKPWEIGKRERISYKTLTSDLKAKLRAAAELVGAQEGDYIEVYQTEDNRYVPTDMYNDDEDRYFYLGRLFKFAERLDTVLEKYGISIPKIYKKDYYILAGVEKPKRQRKIKDGTNP